jgi:6-phosphogluconate dehydrogenase
MMQAIAKGWALLRRHEAPLDLQGAMECWRRGSVIRSWLVMDAMRMEVPVPVIAQSVMQLMLSREKPADRDWARAVIAMRHGFGGHPFGPDESIARERRDARVGPIRRPDRDG